MAQYRRDVFNLAKGPGMAIPDPREDEARAREASRRADQALGLQRIDQAQRSFQVQRQMDLQQEAMQTEAALAAQRSQQFAQEIAQRMNPGSAPLMGRDAIMRQAHTARAANDAFSGAQEARGMAYNQAQQRPTGTFSSSTGPGYGMNGATPRGGVMQAAFDRASGLLGDLGDVGFQVTGRNLLAGEQKQAAEIQDALVRTGIAKRESGARIDDLVAGRKLERDKLTEDSRYNAGRLAVMLEELALKRSGQEFEQKGLQRQRELEEEVRQQALSQQALEFIQTNMPGVFTHGEVDKDVRGMLAAVGAANPKLAAEIARIAQNPEAIRRVRDSATSMFRPESGVNPLGIESNRTRQDAEEREYLRTLSRLGPGVRPFDPEGVEGVAVSERGREILDRLMNEMQVGRQRDIPLDSYRFTMGKRQEPSWWDAEKEAQYQEWSLRPSAALDREFRRRSRR